MPSDTNGVLDVYEYEDGHVYLISSGTSSYESNLEGASENGDDVFFRSNQPLVPQDNQEGQIVIYDARVAGGFAELSSPPACTTADACRAPVPPQPSVYGAPASQTFSGVGNLAPPPEAKSKAKPKAKPVKCNARASGEKKGKCVKTARRRRPRSPSTQQQEGQVMMRSRRISTALSLAVAVVVALGAGASPALAGEAHPSCVEFGTVRRSLLEPERDRGRRIDRRRVRRRHRHRHGVQVRRERQPGRTSRRCGSNALTRQPPRRPGRSRSPRCTATPRRSRSITPACSTPRRSRARPVKNSTPRPATCT